MTTALGRALVSVGLALVATFAPIAGDSGCSVTRSCGSQDVIAAIYDAAAVQGFAWPEEAVCISWHESHHDAYADNAGQLGFSQLAPGGELRGFYSRGFTNPFDPQQHATYLVSRLGEGAGPQAWKASYTDRCGYR